MRRTLLVAIASLLLLLPPASAVHAEGTVWTWWSTPVTGRYTIGANESSLWLRPAYEAGTDIGFDEFRVEAPAITVRSFTYETNVEVALMDRTIVQRQDEEPTVTTETFHDARIVLDRFDLSGQLRLIASTGGSVTVENDGALVIYPDAAHSLDWNHGFATTFPIFSHGLERYDEVPAEHFLYEMERSRIHVGGSVSFLIHGADLSVSSSEGDRQLNGAQETTDFTAGPAYAQTVRWTDYEFRILQGADLDMAWDGHTDFFTPGSEVSGVAAFDLFEATGAMMIDGQATQLDEEPLRVDDVERVEVWWAEVDGLPATFFSFHDAEAGSLATAASGGNGAGLWPWLLVLATVLGGGALGVLGLQRLRGFRSASGEIRPSASNDPVHRAMELVGEGRIDKALPLLESAGRAGPLVPDARYALGVGLARAGRVTEALLHLDYAVQRDPVFLGLLVSDPDTQAFRHRPEVEAFVRRAARRFHDADRRGYA